MLEQFLKKAKICRRFCDNNKKQVQIQKDTCFARAKAQAEPKAKALRKKLTQN
jgi:hypothetical protein